MTFSWVFIALRIVLNNLLSEFEKGSSITKISDLINMDFKINNLLSSPALNVSRKDLPKLIRFNFSLYYK